MPAAPPYVIELSTNPAGRHSHPAPRASLR